MISIIQIDAKIVTAKEDLQTNGIEQNKDGKYATNAHETRNVQLAIGIQETYQK